MKQENTTLKVSFELPDALTVRQQLKYDSIVSLGIGSEMFSRLWEAAKVLISAWVCDIPLTVDIDTVTDSRVTEIIKWAGLLVFSYRKSLDNVPKN